MSMRRETALKEITEGIEGVRIISDVNVPKVTAEDVVANRKLCEKNLCGNYGSSWTCPPNCEDVESCVNKLSKYSGADVLSIRYENLDFSDGKSVERMMGGFQDICRDVMLKCREADIDVLALADGKCNYCERCAFLDGDPCRHPDMRVAPISAHGIDMKRFLNSIGEDFVFEKNAATLYGIFLFK